MIDWETWYQKVKKYPIYKKQEEEIMKILSDWERIVGNFDSVLDVGCGKRRMEKYFKGKKYVGIDKETTGFDLFKYQEWKKIPKNFDLAISILVLMHFNKNQAQLIFKRMRARAKYIFLYEENPWKEEFQRSEDKWNHEYSTWGIKLITGISEINPVWCWYLFEGKVK